MLQAKASFSLDRNFWLFYSTGFHNKVRDKHSSFFHPCSGDEEKSQMTFCFVAKCQFKKITWHFGILHCSRWHFVVYENVKRRSVKWFCVEWHGIQVRILYGILFKMTMGQMTMCQMTMCQMTMCQMTMCQMTML